MAERSLPTSAALLRSLAFAAVFAVAVAVGRRTVVDGTSLSLVWPAAGVAALWFLWQRDAGTRWADHAALAVVTVAGNSLTGASPFLAVAFAVANAVQVEVFVRLSRRWCAAPGGSPVPGSDAVACGIGGNAGLLRLLTTTVLAAAAGACVGPTAVWIDSGHWAWTTTAVWLARNTAAIVLLVALGLRLAVLRLRPPRVPRGAHLAELLGLLAVTGVSYVLVFDVLDGYPVAFPLLALSVWAALRFGTTFVTVHSALCSATAVVLTLGGTGPFAGIDDPAVRALLVQAYVVAVTAVSLTLAFGRDERDYLLEVLRAGAAETERQRVAAEDLRRAAEAATAEAEARAQLNGTVLGTVGVGIVVADADGHLTLFNRTAQEWHGLPADRALDPGDHAGAYDLYGPDGTTPLAVEEIPLTRALREGSVADVEMTIAPVGRPAVTVTCSGRRMTGPDGAVAGAVVAMTDVTAERAQLAALARSEAELQAAFDGSLVGNVHVGLDGTVLRVNAAAAALLGRRPAELVGTAWRRYVHPADRDTVGADPTGVVRYLHRDGRTVHTQVASTTVHDVDGSPVHTAAQLVDLTARVEAEANLRSQRDANARLLDALSDLGEGVLVERAGRVAHVNDAFCRLTGRDRADLLDLPTSLLLVPRQEQDAWAHRLAPGDGSATRTTATRLETPDGTGVPVEVLGIRVDDDGVEGGVEGGAVLTLVRDLSERERAAARLAAGNAELAEANRLKDDLVATLSHDLRQPLSTVIGFSDLLLEEWDGFSDGERRLHLSRVRRAGRWADDLLEDILTMARFEQSAPHAVLGRVHLPALVADLAERLGSEADDVDTTGVQDLSALADRSQLERVLGNLLGNAFKYGRPPVRMLARRRGDLVQLDVVDAGEGVPPEFAPHLFDRFSRAGTGVATTAPGTGLGLHIARTLAVAGGGDLTYRPAAGGGSCFTVTLPAADDPAGGAGGNPWQREGTAPTVVG